jgi:hypothetical protein
VLACLCTYLALDYDLSFAATYDENHRISNDSIARNVGIIADRIIEMVSSDAGSGRSPNATWHITLG